MPNDTTSGRFDTRADFEACVSALLLGLPESDVRELLLVDTDFGRWPLGSVAAVDALSRWIRRPGRRLRLVGLAFDEAARRHPRLALFRRDWAHAIDCLRPNEMEPGDMPCLLLAGNELVEVLDRDHWRGLHTLEAAAARLAMHRIDAILQRCEPAWPANLLGL